MIVQLQQSFKNIKYVDKHHLYYDGETGESLTSVTTLLKKLKQPFDSLYWSTYTSLKRNNYTKLKPAPPYKIYVDEVCYDINNIAEWQLDPSPDDIKKEWEIASKLGTSLGDYLHNTLENKILRKEIDHNIPLFISSLKSLEVIRYLKSREILKNLADQFYNEFIQHYTPICTEFVVGDVDLKIAGTFDMLVHNNETNEIELWDYKTDKQLRYKSDYGNKIREFNVDDCEFEKYSLQLNIYKYLIEKNTDIKIARCKIAHFDHRNNTLSIIETKDSYNIVKEFFENDYNKSIYF